MSIFIRPLSSIIVPDNRIRTEFDPVPLQELADDIADKGLLHPIVLRNDGQTLLAGERRLRAVKLLASQNRTFPFGPGFVQVGQITCTMAADLDDYQLREAELTENIRRVDLSWQDQARATAALHQLYTSADPNHTAADTALEIAGGPVPAGTVKRLVNDQTVLAAHLDNPDVAKAKTAGEAMKIIRRDAEQILLAEAARRASQSALAQGETPLILEKYDMRREDNWATLEASPPECIIADPPYGIDANSGFGDMAQLSHHYDDSWPYASECYAALAKFGYRYSASAAHLYAFLDIQHWQEIFEIFQAFGWWTWKVPLVWNKGNTGLLPYPEHGPRRVTEFILYAIKGSRRVTTVQPDIIEVPNVRHKSHAAEKPAELYINLARRSVRPGERILDPCCGSGVVFDCARTLGLRAVGWETDDTSWSYAHARMRGELVKSQPKEPSE